MKKLIRYIMLQYITETELNQTIENKLNTEIIHNENSIPENKIIQETHHEETKPESDLQKSKTINWLSVFPYVCFFFLVIICLVYAKSFFFNNTQIQHEPEFFYLYANILNKNNFGVYCTTGVFKIEEGDSSMRDIIYYISDCLLKDMTTIKKPIRIGNSSYDKMIKIEKSKINLDNVIFFNEPYFSYIFYLKDTEKKLILIKPDARFEDYKQEIKQLNSNIDTKDEFFLLRNFFIDKKKIIHRNIIKQVKTLKNPIDIINTGLSLLPNKNDFASALIYYYIESSWKRESLKIIILYKNILCYEKTSYMSYFFNCFLGIITSTLKPYAKIKIDKEVCSSKTFKIKEQEFNGVLIPKEKIIEEEKTLSDLFFFNIRFFYFIDTIIELKLIVTDIKEEEITGFSEFLQEKQNKKISELYLPQDNHIYVDFFNFDQIKKALFKKQEVGLLLSEFRNRKPEA